MLYSHRCDFFFFEFENICRLWQCLCMWCEYWYLRRVYIHIYTAFYTHIYIHKHDKLSHGYIMVSLSTNRYTQSECAYSKKTIAILQTWQTYTLVYCISYVSSFIHVFVLPVTWVLNSTRGKLTHRDTKSKSNNKKKKRKKRRTRNISEQN